MSILLGPLVFFVLSGFPIFDRMYLMKVIVYLMKVIVYLMKVIMYLMKVIVYLMKVIVYLMKVIAVFRYVYIRFLLFVLVQH